MSEDKGARRLPTLETERLLLRPFELADSALVQSMAGERAIADTTLTVPHPYPDGAAETWIGGHPGAWQRREALQLAVTFRTPGPPSDRSGGRPSGGPSSGPSSGISGELIGAVGLRLTLHHSHAELGYWIGMPFWGCGYATEAARAILDFGFEGLGLHRIYAHCLERNPASGRVLEKLGMLREGRLREHFLKWGRPETALLYGILRSERDATLATGL